MNRTTNTTKLAKWWHKRGHHKFTIPISLVEKQNYYIEGEKGSSRNYRESVSYYTKKRCKYCTKRSLIHEKTIETTNGYGTDWA